MKHHIIANLLGQYFQEEQEIINVPEVISMADKTINLISKIPQQANKNNLLVWLNLIRYL
jgi:hypothetical protein